jgi:hypothetical protein
MGQLRHILVHTATPVRFEEADAGAATWVEGERGETGPEPVLRDAFPAVLFLPGGSEESDHPRTKKITRPTLLYEPVNADTGQPVPELTAEDELMVEAPELAQWTGEVEARWQVEGTPQPFGPPGRVIGVQATLKQVREGKK